MFPSVSVVNPFEVTFECYHLEGARTSRGGASFQRADVDRRVGASFECAGISEFLTPLVPVSCYYISMTRQLKGGT